MQQHLRVVTDIACCRRNVWSAFTCFRWPLLAMLLLFGVSPAASAATALNMLHDFFQNSHTITAHFNQEVANHNGQIVKRASGELWISRPGKFRWDYSGKVGQTIVSNGRKVWLYEPVLQQVTIRSLDKALGSTPAALIAGKDDLSARFDISSLGLKDGLRWLLLRPKDGQDQGFTALRLGFGKKGMLREMRMEDAFQQETVLRFSDIELNHPIPVQKFQFSPPTGVAVLTQ